MRSFSRSSTSRPSAVAAYLALFLAVALGPGIALGQNLIRNEIPADWEGTPVNWVRDTSPRNKIDDLIEASSDSLFDIVVNYREHITPADITFLDTIGDSAFVQMQLKYITSVLVAQVSKDEIQTISQQPQVAFIEQQVPFQALLDVSTEAIRVQAGFYSPQTVEDIAPALTGAGVTIAIMDTGVDEAHAAFAATPFIGGYDAVTETLGNPPDPNGHGTHVASIALGQATANHDRGVAPAAGLVDVRVLDATGAGNFAMAVDGLQTILDNADAWSVDVVNMSFGGGHDNGLSAFSQLVDIAESMGIVMVAAAGNAGPGNVGFGTPAAATRAITVAASNDGGTATRADDVIAGFSNRGPRDDDGDNDCLDELKPDVTAPGFAINAANAGTPDGAIAHSGTSMAAPHVAGFAALLIQSLPGINPASVKGGILSTAEPVGAATNPACTDIWNDTWGWGLIDVYEALAIILTTDMTFPNYPFNPGWTSTDIILDGNPTVGQPIDVAVRVRNVGGNAANDVRVGLGVHVFSAATPTFYDVGSRVLDVPPNTTVNVNFTWTPQAGDHQCLKAEIGFIADTDHSNNVTSRNVTVAMSPVFFEVKNTATEGTVTIDLVATITSTVNGVPSPWPLSINPSQVMLSADDPAVVVSAEFTEPPGVVFGVDSAVAHIEAIALTGGGDVSIGGVTVIDHADPVTPIPSASEWSMIFMALGLLVVSAFVFRRRGSVL